MEKAMGDKEQPAVIFIHIPKTAGQTLYLIVKRQYPSDSIKNFKEGIAGSYVKFLNSSASERSLYQFYWGHIPYGLHEVLNKPCEYFTFLRVPVERTISHYYFLASEKDHPLKDLYGEDFIPLKELLEKGADPLLFNCQTRHLSGVMYEAKPGECTREHLEIAKENLRFGMRVIGLTERFDQSLILLQDAFGWEDVRYVRDNVSTSRPAREAIDMETMELIIKANLLDQELYAYARELFQERTADRAAEIERRVLRLRLSNSLQYLIAAIRKRSVREYIRKRQR
ncbi:MAG: sulfotransferase family 2 domain-containing protein [Candidatus Promineifilaceae bacterium]